MNFSLSLNFKQRETSSCRTRKNEEALSRWSFSLRFMTKMKIIKIWVWCCSVSWCQELTEGKKQHKQERKDLNSGLLSNIDILQLIWTVNITRQIKQDKCNGKNTNIINKIELHVLFLRFFTLVTFVDSKMVSVLLISSCGLKKQSKKSSWTDIYTRVSF